MEFLVLLACLSGKGCSESAHQYYNQSQQAQDSVKYLQYKLDANYGHEAVTATGTSILFISGSSWTYKLNERYLLKGSNRCSDIGLSYSYSY